MNFRRNLSLATVILLFTSITNVAYGAKPTPYTTCLLSSLSMQDSPVANSIVSKAPGGTFFIQFIFNVNFTYTSIQNDILPISATSESGNLNYKSGGNSFLLDVVQLKNNNFGTWFAANLVSVDVITNYFGAKNRLISSQITSCNLV